MGALYTAIVLGNHPVRIKLQRIFFESVRQGVTKRKILVLPFRKQKISQVGFVRLAVLRLEAPELDFFIKASFQESKHDDDSFQFKKKKQNVLITSWFCGKVMQWLRCQLLLIASTWSLIIPHNGDATTVLCSFLFVWVSLPRTTAKLNFSQNPWK